MNTLRNWIALLVVATAASGCVVSIGGHDREEHPPRRSETPKPSPVIVVPGNTEDSATIAEIDAISKLNFDQPRQDGFRAVATRSGLSPGVQVHLVNTTVRSLNFDAAKVEVLVALVQNPSFSVSAKEAIFKQLDHLSFDASKSTVMSAIQERSKTP